MSLDHDALIEYLADRHGLEPDEIDAETSLFSSRLLDSFAMVELMVFVESRAGVKMKPSDVTLDNLDSLAKILRWVERTRTVTAGPA